MGNKTFCRPSQEHDTYLKAAATARIPVAVHFLDGEAIPCATIKNVGVFTILFEIEGTGDVLVYKNAIKKIMVATLPATDSTE